MTKYFSTIFFFIVVVFVSGAFRVTNLDLIEYKADEAINIFLASRFLFEHPIPPGSTASSIGVLNFPLMNYLLFPMILLSTDPRIISFIIALINSLTLGFLFLIINKYYGFSLAIITSILMALSPWMILFSRKIWAQDFVIPLSIPLFFSLHKIVIEKDSRFWMVLIFSSLLLIQLHQSLIFFLVPALTFMLIIKPRLSMRYIFIGFILGFIPALPYIMYQVSNGCPDCQTLLFANERLAVYRSLSIFARPFQILSQGNFNHVIGGDMETFAKNSPIIFEVRKLFYIEYLLLPIGMYIFWKQHRNLRFLIYASIILPILYYLLKIEPFIHYFIILSPLLFLFLAYSIMYFINFKHMIVKLSAIALFISLIIVSILFNFAFLKLLNINKSLRGDYGIAYIANEFVVKKPLKKYKNDPAYKEMVLANFVPRELLYGYLPLGRMLYDHDKSRKNIPQLEKRLKAIPQDPLATSELLAFYTYEIPTKKTLDFLKIKAKEGVSYDLIYDHAYRIYLQKNLKKSYKNDVFRLEYPEHWDAKETQDGIVISGDSNSLTMKKTTDKTKGTKVVKLGGDHYEILYEPASQDAKIIQTLDEIVESIRLIN